MRVIVSERNPKNESLVLFAFENGKAPAGMPSQNKIVSLAQSEGFKGKENSAVILHPASGSPSKQVVLVGLGNEKKCTLETLRRASALGIKKVQSISQSEISIFSPGIFPPEDESRSICEGAMLSNYKFNQYKSKKDDLPEIKQLRLVCSSKNISEAKKGARLAEILSSATNFTRDIVNKPANEITPTKLGEIAKEISEKSKNITLKIFNKEQIEEMKMGAFLGVNRGSAEPPVLIHLHYKPEEPVKKPIAFVGKGLTFDSGGLSLKNADNMETMKMDMAGGGAILGLFTVIEKLKLPIEVHGIIPATENMPGGRAYKPGDVLKTMSGKTIEVLNTDAEGRIVLSDALVYAEKQNVDAVIDIATLTGAVIIALGSLVAGLMSNDKELLQQIMNAGEKSGERYWEMPLLEDYKADIKSPVADIKNIGPRREAGVIIGGLFLQEFIDKVKWAHLDIAGTAWTDKDWNYNPRGATGFSVRTLIHYLLEVAS